jgi:hypothetical protein
VGLLLVEHAELIIGVGEFWFGSDGLLQRCAGLGVVPFFCRLMQEGRDGVGGGLEFWERLAGLIEPEIGGAKIFAEKSPDSAWMSPRVSLMLKLAGGK